MEPHDLYTRGSSTRHWAISVNPVLSSPRRARHTVEKAAARVYSPAKTVAAYLKYRGKVRFDDVPPR